MKQLLLIIIAHLFLSTPCSAKTTDTSSNTATGIARTVISEATGEPVVYAGVGIINRKLGTVTDTLGHFQLSVPDEYRNDSIRISSVGYVARTFAVKDLKSIPDTIRLADDAVTLGEVIVKPHQIEHKTAGRRSAGGFIYINVEGYKAAGQGLAVPLNVNKSAWIKSIGFTVVVNDRTLSHMKFRVNVYVRNENGYEPLKSVAPLYFDYNKSDLTDGLFSYTFPEEIMLERGKYYVELEFLENFTTETFLMQTRPLTGKTRYRYASQSDWETIPFGAPLFVEYDTLK